jgi:hypothetical protein
VTLLRKNTVQRGPYATHRGATVGEGSRRSMPNSVAATGSFQIRSAAHSAGLIWPDPRTRGNARSRPTLMSATKLQVSLARRFFSANEPLAPDAGTLAGEAVDGASCPNSLRAPRTDMEEQR